MKGARARLATVASPLNGVDAMIEREARVLLRGKPPNGVSLDRVEAAGPGA